MRILKLTFLTGMLLVLASAACGPQSATTTSQPAATEAASAAAQPQATATDTLVPINLAGPKMEVGSTWPYVDGTTLVAVPGGEFTMGHGGFDNPEHKVTLPDFWAYSTEVTNRQFAFCVQQGGCTPPSQKDNAAYGSGDPLLESQPVVGVTWDQAAAYCTFVHGRLPTEAEWEKLARGPDGNIYPWGNNAPACDLLNMDGCVGNPSPVTDYPPGASFYGALDMEGNTYEWVADKYQPDYYLNSPADNPLGPDTGTERSVRSSAFDSGANQTQAFNRFHTRPEGHRNNLGFRCVVEDPAYYAPFCEVQVVYGNTSGGGSENTKCPDPVISHSPDCNANNQPIDRVSVHADPPTTIQIQNLDQCTPSNNLADTSHECGPNIQIMVQAQCNLQPSGQAQCPPNYTMTKDGKSCVSNGGPGEACPAGFAYDPAMQCCSVQGNNSVKPLCRSGYHDYQGLCVPDKGGLVQPNSSTYTTGIDNNICKRGGGSDEGNPQPQRPPGQQPPIIQ